MLDQLTSHPHASLILLVVIIAILCALIAFFRGVFRLLLLTSMLATSFWVAYRVWIVTADWANGWWQHPPDWAPYVLPSIAGLFALVFLRKLAHSLFSPLSWLGGKPESQAERSFSMTASLIPTALLCLIAVLFIRHLGTIRQIENPNTTALTALWKEVIDRYLPAEWMQRLDPLTDPLRLTLAQWISQFNQGAAHSEGTSELPASKRLLQDPKWKRLLREGRYSELLRDPELEEALQDPKVQKALENLRKEVLSE